MMTSSNENIFRVTDPLHRGIHRSPGDSHHKGQWRGASMFSLICARASDWANHWDTGDLRRHRVHYDVTVKHGSFGFIVLWYHQFIHILHGHSNDSGTIKYNEYIRGIWLIRHRSKWEVDGCFPFLNDKWHVKKAHSKSTIHLLIVAFYCYRPTSNI